MANRNSAKMNDGSLSDTQPYADVKPEFNTYAMWLKHSSTTASRLSEGDSLESVSIVSSPGLSRNSKLIQSRESTPIAQQPGQNSRLNRSNSIRYKKSPLEVFQCNFYKKSFSRLNSFQVVKSFLKMFLHKIFSSNFNIFVSLNFFASLNLIQLSTRSDVSKVQIN